MSRNKSRFIYIKRSDRDIEAYLPQLNTIDTISKKMEKLCQLVVLSKYDIANRQRILEYIHSLFQCFFPDCLLVPFGSSINGFGTKGCDMDMMFSPSPVYEHLDASEIDDEFTPSIRDIRANPSVLAQLMYMSKEKQLRFLLNVLRCDCFQLKEAVYIPAKCPIVRFLISHMHYDLWCDLSFQHGLAVVNSKLLHFFSELDTRVKPLMITLRFWAKHLDIINIGAFSSYAFSLLVIFFLQNIEEPILPPVNDLMTNAESYVVDGWEAGFVSDVPKDFKTRNALSEEELLKEFFKFYWNFDFAENVVCIRTGKVMPISDIRKDTDERMMKFVIADVCVQDPINLSHNVASSLKLSKLHLLKPYFFVGNLILSKQLQSFECEDAFQQLFEEELFETKIKELFFSPEPNAFDCFYVYPNFQVIATIGDHCKIIWFKQACEAIRDILEYIFLFDCEVIDKNYLVQDDDRNRNHDKLLLSIQCAVSNKVYKYRNTKKDMPLDSYTQDFANEVLKKRKCLITFSSCFKFCSPKSYDFLLVFV